MTDGIIQEVLNHYRDMRYQNYDHRSIIDLLQQELIEKIKQESGFKYIRLTKLIGDNQE